MKSIEVIIKQSPVFLNNWSSEEDVIIDFSVNAIYNKVSETFREDLGCMKILFASYVIESDGGEAFVLLERDNKLYEINGSHCSCYGLEDQWEEEEVVLEELKNRLINGTLGCDNGVDYFAIELMNFLGIDNEELKEEG